MTLQRAVQETGPDGDVGDWRVNPGSEQLNPSNTPDYGEITTRNNSDSIETLRLNSAFFMDGSRDERNRSCTRLVEGMALASVLRWLWPDILFPSDSYVSVECTVQEA